MKGTRSSYDAIRKAIILLYSYKFWKDPCNNKLKEERGTSICEKYESELDDLLFTCGLHTLNPKNPFDWFFLFSTVQADNNGDLQCALDKFRQLVELTAPYYFIR